MKTKIMSLAVAAFVLCSLPTHAQFWRQLGNTAENAAKNATIHQTERTIERSIDRAVEGAEDAAVNATTDAINNKNKDKKDKNNKKDNEPELQSQSQSAGGWTCPACGTKGNNGKFCNECGAKKPEPSDGTWTCPACGAKGNTGKFCNECGTKRPEQQSDVWTCPACGHEGNTGKFCDECGAKRDGTKQAERAASEWNKFDFVPGDEVIFYDQLENEQLGEFPSKWELIKGEAEIQKVNGENVIALMNDVRIMPLIEPMWNYLPDVYTIEFDYYEVLQKHGEYYGALSDA